MTYEFVPSLLERFDGVRAAVVGDFCLDVYWYADMTLSRLSRETPHFPYPIVREVMSPGAAGNVANNLQALKPAALSALTVMGDDWRGVMLKKALSERGIDTSLVITQPGRMTNAYIKPMLKGTSAEVQEAPRLDFENTAPLSAPSEEALIGALERLAEKIDVLCVCDQMANGCITGRVIETINDLGAKGLKVIVDSRERVGLFKNVIVKPNDMEALAATGASSPEDAAKILCAHTERCAVVTVGPEGALVADQGTVTRVPAFAVEGPIDICGAGDTFMASFSCALAAGATPEKAAALGSAASAVTIKKLGMTGTATREEIIRRVK